MNTPDAGWWGTGVPPVIEPNSIEARTLHPTIEHISQASGMLERFAASAKQ
jgi:hypothetical protein